MDAAEDEDPAALGGEGFDDGLDLAEGVAGMQLPFQIAFGLQQFQVRDGFEADDLVAAGVVDDEVAGDGEEVGATGGDGLPSFGGIGPGQHLRDHVVQILRRGKDPPQP